MHWADAGKRWLEEKRDKASLVDDIGHLLWLGPHLDHKYLKDISKELIEDIAKKKEAVIKKNGDPIKPATVNRMLALVKSILNKCAKEWGWLNTVPYIRMREENNERVRWITFEQARKLIALLQKKELWHLADMTAFSLLTGLRKSNVLGLEWHRINFEKKFLWVDRSQSKNNNTFSRVLNEEAINILRRWQGKHEQYVFTYRNKSIGECNTRAWRAAVKEAGIEDFHWHDLRHTWASWHVQNGTTLHELYEMGDWESYDMVLRYAHLCNTQIIKVSENISGAKLVQPQLLVA